MPTVLRGGATRFFFYGHEGNEPPHVHVQRGSAVAKFWIRPVTLDSSTGFRAHDLRRVSKLVRAHENRLLEDWNDFFTR